MDAPVSIPACVGIILDGNRRWAKAKGLLTLEGHKAGADNLEKMAKHIFSRGVRHLAVYAFSTENWQRSEEEVAYLMDLVKASEDLFERLSKEGVRVRFIGQRDRLSGATQRNVKAIEAASADAKPNTIWVCLSYGGRAEITEAAAQLAAEGAAITEEALRAHMWSAEMPDPDIIIRTSGEMRLSNFLLWQSAYSELFFSETYWPDFSESEFDAILEAYAARERRNGK